MDTITSPTKAQRRWVYALNGLYIDNELSDAGRERAQQIVASKEISLDENTDFALVASYLLDEKGRWRTLRTIYRNFMRQREAGGEMDEWYFVTMAEFAEIQRLLDIEEYDTAIVRGTSFAEHFLDDNVDWFSYTPIEFEPDEEATFAELINFARKEGFIDDTHQKLLHFIREIRNHTAHHAWLLKDVHLDLILIAGRSLLWVIVALLEEKAQRDNIRLPDLDPGSEEADDFISQVEDDFGWTYNEYKKFWIKPSI